MSDPSVLDSVTLRPVTPLDMEFLYHLYASTRELEMAPVPWTPAEKEAFLRHQFSAQRTWWTEHYPDATFDLVLRDGQPVGRLYVDRWPGEIRIVDISLVPEERGRGVGSALLRRVLAEGDRAGKPVSIHVEMYNPARRLYERLGFVEKDTVGVYILMQRPPGS